MAKIQHATLYHALASISLSGVRVLLWHDPAGPEIGYFHNSCVPPVEEWCGAAQQLINIQMSSAEHLAPVGRWVTHSIGFIVRSIETLRWNVNFYAVSWRTRCLLSWESSKACSLHILWLGKEVDFLMLSWQLTGLKNGNFFELDAIWPSG